MSNEEQSRPASAATVEPSPPFAGSTAMVIGGGRNIGRAIVLEFARRGARVVAADLDFDGAQETAALVEEATGVESHAVRIDVGNDESVREAIDEAERQVGPLDILMNNAGILSGGNPEDIPVAAWQRIMDINFFGMVRAIHVVLPRMLERGSGYVVNTASFAGLYPFASSRVHYGASKAAVVSMSQNLALHCLPLGVRISCLCPGPVMTTSNQTMQHFSEDYIMRGPGSSLAVKSQAETATILADGMRDGRILIPTHEELWGTLKRYAASPQDFVQSKLDEFASGDHGRPGPPTAAPSQE